MENRTFYNEILTDHNLHPLHKEKLPDANLVLEVVPRSIPMSYCFMDRSP
mgnify:CR=1 FL=1